MICGVMEIATVDKNNICSNMNNLSSETIEMIYVATEET